MLIDISIIPGGVLPGDKRIAFPDDPTCSRCGRIPRAGESTLAFTNKSGNKGLRYCEKCLAKPKNQNDIDAARNAKKGVAKSKKKMSKIKAQSRGGRRRTYLDQ